MPIGVEEVGLHTRIDDHQHRKKRLARLGVVGVRLGSRNDGPVFNYMSGKPMRKALQCLILLLSDHLPA